MLGAADVTVAEQAAAAQGSAERARSATRFLPAVVILLAPLIGVLALRAPVMNALAYRDPWFYSGYGWELAHHVEIFGWFYYAVRFPVNLPIMWAADLFGPTAGYVLLRYAILAATGAVLYACLVRATTRWIACAGVLLLALSPFYLRMVLWDYTSFICMPATIAAVAVWHLGRTRNRRFVSAAGSGALTGAAMFANPIVFVLIPALYGVEAVAALREGRSGLVHFLLRTVISVAGAGAVFLLGYLGYRIYLGGEFTPYDLVEPTLAFARETAATGTPFQIPARTWLAHEPRIYGPPLVCLATVLVMGRSLLDNTRIARLAQFAIAYTVVVFVYRKFQSTAFIEVWWAYSLTAITPCFALPALLDALSRRSRAVVVAVSAVLGAVVADLVVRSFNVDFVAFYLDVRMHVWLLVLLLAVAVALAVALTLVRSPRVSAGLLGAFVAAWLFFSLAPAEYIGIHSTGEFSVLGGQRELDTYESAYDMTKLLARYDQPDDRVFLWSTLEGASNVGWVNLPHQQGGIQNSEAPVGFNTLTDGELALLRYPTTRGVLIVADLGESVAAGLRRLEQSGFSPQVLQEGQWGDGVMSYALVDIRNGSR